MHVMANKNQHNKKNNNNKNYKGNNSKKTSTIVSECSYSEGITVKELAEKTNINATDIVKFLFMMGKMITLNSTLDDNTILLSPKRKLLTVILLRMRLLIIQKIYNQELQL